MRLVLKWGLLALVLSLIGFGIAVWRSQVLQVRVIEATGISNWYVPPAKIAENVWYVGGYDAAAFLITGPRGHILIDGAYSDSAPIILANIRALGFRPNDVKVILNTHGHFDHAAGIAALKRATGAQLFASPEEAKLIKAGGRGDFHFRDRFAYEATQVDKLLGDNEAVTLGGPALTAHFTPGHTKGCTSWSATVSIAGKLQPLLLICSLSQLGATREGNAAYPGIVQDFRASISRLSALPCAIFLTPHGTQFDVSAKAAAVNNGKADAFVDPAGCKSFIAQNSAAFTEALAHQ